MPFVYPECTVDIIFACVVMADMDIKRLMRHRQGEHALSGHENTLMGLGHFHVGGSMAITNVNVNLTSSSSAAECVQTARRTLANLVHVNVAGSNVVGKKDNNSVSVSATATATGDSDDHFPHCSSDSNSNSDSDSVNDNGDRHDPGVKDLTKITTFMVPRGSTTTNPTTTTPTTTLATTVHGRGVKRGASHQSSSGRDQSNKDESQSDHGSVPDLFSDDSSDASTIILGASPQRSSQAPETMNTTSSDSDVVCISMHGRSCQTRLRRSMPISEDTWKILEEHESDSD